jgi:hypothetical protein
MSAPWPPAVALSGLCWCGWGRLGAARRQLAYGRLTSKITGLPPATLISNSAQSATPVHFFVIRIYGNHLFSIKWHHIKLV